MWKKTLSSFRQTFFTPLFQFLMIVFKIKKKEIFQFLVQNCEKEEEENMERIHAQAKLESVLWENLENSFHTLTSDTHRNALMVCYWKESLKLLPTENFFRIKNHHKLLLTLNFLTKPRHLNIQQSRPRFKLPPLIFNLSWDSLENIQ